jgi:hypothetical protein
VRRRGGLVVQEIEVRHADAREDYLVAPVLYPEQRRSS